LVLPLAAFALAWMIAGKIPMAVPKAEWGTWFMMGALLGLAGITGFVFCVRAFMRSGYRGMAIAAVVLNIVVLLIAWAGLFA
jgi:phage terminase large subunit-like protein